MNEDLETFTRTMVIERLVVGALVGLTPGAALKLFGLSEDDNTPALRYVGRIFGIRKPSSASCCGRRGGTRLSSSGWRRSTP
jgi:hypothetical protein